jgi:hypothetical protein
MGPLTPIIGFRLLALAAGLRHNAEIGQPGLCFSAYGHKFGINHLEASDDDNGQPTQSTSATMTARFAQRQVPSIGTLGARWSC